MAQQLPPLNPLRFFEAAARLGNYRLVAEELHVTASAVSHSILTLEAWFGAKVFERGPQGLRPARPAPAAHRHPHPGPHFGRHRPDRGRALERPAVAGLGAYVCQQLAGSAPDAVRGPPSGRADQYRHLQHAAGPGDGRH